MVFRTRTIRLGPLLKIGCFFAGKRKRYWIAGIVAIAILLTLDRLYPLPTPGRDSPFALLVLARDGTPLRAFPDRDHVWRHPVGLNQVSPLYLEALIRYEDKTFWWHPGTNPFALLRAAWQWATQGEIVSGGSTITMQVARMLDPTPRTLKGKLWQIARATQIEWHYSKKEILELYLNYAPMGGVLEGVEAASRAYLGKPSKRLTHAEAALLTVLPQSPSLLRPDRYPQKARTARDKVIRRMSSHWSYGAMTDALSEPISARMVREPSLAPLLAQRMKQEASGSTHIGTTIDATAQSIVEGLLKDRVRLLPPRMSMATMVMDNRTAEVVAYAGSADFSDKDRFSHVDMVRASRSPGSTLKPFLYGFALDEGMIHSESLLADTPQSFSGYEPGNFQQTFHGPVSVSEALIKSLNVPAVQVLEQLGPAKFVAQLRRGGLKLRFPRGAEPNLSVILGGAGTTLEELVSAYSSFARKGVAVKPRFTARSALHEFPMMSEGAAFIVRDILEAGGPIGRIAEGQGVYKGIAWKTGTSFGFRDAWAVGVSDRYTIGVWVGRPDGTPNPGFFGANVAAPLLVDIFTALPTNSHSHPGSMPTTVNQQRICWPLGTRYDEGSPHLCPIQRTAWILDGAVPPTLADKVRSGSPVYAYYVDSKSGQRVIPECAKGAAVRIEAARWPSTIEPWLDAGLRQRTLPPAWAADCHTIYRSDEGIKIVGLNHGEVLRRAHGKDVPKARLEIRGSRGHIRWMVNGQLIAKAAGTFEQLIEFPATGRYDITAFDDYGRYDRISVSMQ